MNQIFPPRILTDFPATFVPIGTYIPPFTEAELLDRLGVADAPRPEQDAAITAWLAANEPSLGLVISLADHGYYARRAGGRRAGRRAGKAAVRAAWERAKVKHGFA